MIKYPPFPDAPEGVTIIPFSEFKPQGIKKFIDPSPDDVELDGIGIPTATLQVKHDEEKWKKKKRRMGDADDDGIVRKYYWWEEWEKDESGRKSTVADLYVLLSALGYASDVVLETPRILIDLSWLLMISGAEDRGHLLSPIYNSCSTRSVAIGNWAICVSLINPPVPLIFWVIGSAPR